jgi:hypothetical protein
MKRKQSKAKTKPKRPKAVRDLGLDQPAGYHLGGSKIATLREVLDSEVPTMSLAELTEQQRVDLAVARLQARRADLRIAMIGPGSIDKNRAIAELQARSRIGRTLIEIEYISLANLLAASSN